MCAAQDVFKQESDVSDGSVFSQNDTKDIFVECDLAENDAKDLSDSFESCLDSHTDTDDEGPNGAWLDTETGNIFYFVDIEKTNAILVGLNVLSIDKDGNRTYERGAISFATFKDGQNSVSDALVNSNTFQNLLLADPAPVAPILECIRIDNNTIFCMLVTGDTVRVFVFCRENNKWRACQQDRIHITS